MSVDEHAYVTCHWPASVGAEELPTLGFCCHLDTAWQSWGDPVRPRVVRYEGGELAIGTGRDGRPVTLSPDVNPELERMVGGELVVTDGTSPIADATVKLFDSAGMPYKHTLTDATGAVLTQAPREGDMVLVVPEMRHCWRFEDEDGDEIENITLMISRKFLSQAAVLPGL